MASMYGFVSEEEMEDTKAYLLSHGKYHLEQVGEWVSVLHFVSDAEWMSDGLLNNWMSDGLACL